jgi:DNA-binding CsgD family transcriptional regulator
MDATIEKVTARISSPELVDRSSQLAALESCWRDATAGRPRVVVIRGGAGVGKTRLVGAFESALPAQVLVLHGGCVRLDIGAASLIPFRLVTSELIERWGLKRVRVLAGGGAPALSSLVPDLAASTSTSTGETLDAMARLLDKVSREAPLVVIIEDLHWADAATRETVDYLSRALRTSRMLLIATLRTGPDEQSPASSLIGELMTLARVETVDLVPLTESGVRRQLRGIIGRPPAEELADRIVGRSQGVPLFVEELAAAEAAGESGVPGRLREILLLRTTGLSSAAASVMRAAAVAGRPVDESTLVRVCGLDRDGVEAALRDLVDATVLVVDRVAGTMDFRHALLREAVDSQLLPSEAARLHRRYAELLEADAAQGASRRNMEAADHWWLAGDLAQARRAALAAAVTARSLGLHREEWRLLTRVLHLQDEDDGSSAPDSLDRVALLHAAGLAACRSGEYTAGYECLDSALQLLDLPLDAARSIEILFDAAELVGSIPQGIDQTVETAVRSALAALPDEPSRPRMLGDWALACCHLHRGERRQAWDLLQAATRCADTIGEWGCASRIRVLLAAYFAGSWIPAEEGRALYRDARRVATQHADPILEMRALINEVDFLVAGEGSFTEAEHLAREMLTVGESFAVPAGMTDTIVGNLAEALLATGGWAEGVDRLRSVLEVDRPSPERGYLYVLLATLSLALGDLTGARVAAENGHARFSGDSTAPQYLVAYAALEAELALERGRPADAVRLAAESLQAHWPHTWNSRSCELIDVVARARRRLPAPANQLSAEFASVVEHVRSEMTNKSMAWWPTVFTAELSDNLGHWESALRAVTDFEVPVLVGLRTQIATARARLLAGQRDVGAALLIEAAGRAEALHARGQAAEIGNLTARFRLSARQDATSAAAADDLAALTPRELEVLRLVAAGHSNGRIASELHISIKTVSIHVSHVLTKLSVSSRGQAAAAAWRAGITVPASR